MRLYQTKKLLHVKRNKQKNEKSTEEMGESICIDMVLIFKIHKDLTQLNSKKPPKATNIKK